MKQIFLILSIVPFLFGCVQTREQRGAEIAKSEMMKRLYDADSYEPIETQIAVSYTHLDVYKRQPVFSAPGNHDNDPTVANDDFAAAGPFRQIIGPTDFSFNIGNVHYILPDIIAIYYYIS